jgi:hypothetical protein
VIARSREATKGMTQVYCQQQMGRACSHIRRRMQHAEWMYSKLLAKKFRPLLHALEDDPTQSRMGMIPLRADSASTMLATRIDKLHCGNCCTGVYFGRS